MHIIQHTAFSTQHSAHIIQHSVSIQHSFSIQQPPFRASGVQRRADRMFLRQKHKKEMYKNCNWILALTSVCLVGLLGWTAAQPDACDDLTHVFHNGSMQSCLAVTDSGFQALGSIDDCPNACDRRQYKALGGGMSTRRLETVQPNVQKQASSAKMPCPGFPYYHAALVNGGVFGGCLYGEGNARCLNSNTHACACFWRSEDVANSATTLNLGYATVSNLCKSDCPPEPESC